MASSTVWARSDSVWICLGVSILSATDFEIRNSRVRHYPNLTGKQPKSRDSGPAAPRSHQRAEAHVHARDFQDAARLHRCRVADGGAVGVSDIQRGGSNVPVEAGSVRSAGHQGLRRTCTVGYSLAWRRTGMDSLDRRRLKTASPGKFARDTSCTLFRSSPSART